MTSRVGDRVEGAFPVAGSAIPLRPGVWSILSEVRKTPKRASYVSYCLGLAEDGRLKEAMIVNSLISDPADKDRYAQIKEFDNELYNVTVENEADGSQACWAIRNMITGPWLDPHDKTTGISDRDRAVAREIQRRNLVLPPEFLLVQFVRREPSRALEAQYLVDVADVGPEPAREPASWRDGDFAPLNVRRHPEKFARFRDTVDWASGWWPKFRDCFDNFQPMSSW